MKEELRIRKVDTDEKNITQDEQIQMFWKPVHTQLYNSKEANKVKAIVIIFITFIFALLIFLFFSLILPNDQHVRRKGATTLVDGTKITKRKLPFKLQAPKDETEKVSTVEDADEIVDQQKPLHIKNIALSDDEESIEEKIKREQPELAKKLPAPIIYTIRSGDTLEKIAIKYYGSATYENISKIKSVNGIKNSRFIRVGQKLTIPL
jgi:LysM repeat protein